MTSWLTSKKHQEGGFTLVELLVVILIIGVLAAVAIPAFMNQRQRANDSTLETDMRNVATAYQTWQLGNGNDNARYREIINNRNSSYVEHPEGVNSTNANVLRWHDSADLPNTPVSPGSVIEVVVITSPNNLWTRQHEEGEFCLVGSMRNSSWDYIPNAGMGFENYDRLLFFDAKLGGLKTFDEILKAFDAGQEMSCEGHPRRYRDVIAA